MTVVGLFADGRKVLRQAITAKVGTGNLGVVTAAFETPNGIAFVLQVNLNLSPMTTGTVTNRAIVGNIVGLTVVVGAGTTVSGEVLVVAN